MDFVLDILPRYSQAFGFVAPDTNPTRAAMSGKYSGASVFVKSGYNFADVTLTGQTLIMQMGSKLGVTDSTSVAFVAPPMISITREKQINVTSPDRGEAEIVENWSKKSYDITFKGIMVDMEDHHYPKGGVQSIRYLFDFNGTYDITCELLNDLGIYTIYFTSIDDLSGVEGYQDTLSYTLRAKSFQPGLFNAF